MTFGDPEIGGRPPRYQNWNAGVQRTLWRTLTLGATYAGSRGDFLGGSGRGFYSNQMDPRFLVLGNLLTQQASAATIAAAQAIVPGVKLPYTGFSGTIGQMLRPFPQYSGVTDVYGDLARSTYHSIQLTLEKRRSDDGLIVNFNYTYSRTEDNLAARTGYNFDQDSPPATCRTRGPATPISHPASRAMSASTATTGMVTCWVPRRPPTSTAPHSSRPRRSPTGTRRGRSRSICAIRAPSIRISASGATSARRS